MSASQHGRLETVAAPDRAACGSFAYLFPDAQAVPFGSDPVDGVRASGQLVDSIPALLRAALLVEG